MPKLTTTFEYPAVQFQQSAQGGKLILLSAPVNEIGLWAGIPRKEQKKGVETVGFQRTENQKRVREIGQFLDQEQNLIANPILCAARDKSAFAFETKQTFDNGRMEFGILRVTVPDYDKMSMKELLSAVRQTLEARSPGLDTPEVEEFVKENLKQVAQQPIQEDDSDVEEVDEEESDVDSDTSETEETIQDVNEDITFSSESHIEDFYQAVRLREAAAENSQSDFDELLGWKKPFLSDYLKAAMIVDGQHRLLGAQRELADRLDNSSTEISQLLDEDITLEEAKAKLEETYARRFGISLIVDADWPEHVFQFVVVNQKASPISKPLLSSIIATTLTDNEINSIKVRLEKAGIHVSDYVALNYMIAAPESPFKNLIKRGIGEEGEEKKLENTVADTLIKMFRELSKARPLYGSGAQDNAQFLASKSLGDWKFLDDYEQKGFKTRREYWESEDGPWREFFVTFWTAVRDDMANTDDENARNYWGKPKDSNLFNGVHLTILATDFFEFLWERQPVIENMDDLKTIISEKWLQFVRERCKEYFFRDWELKGLKKTDAGVKKRWAEEWKKFRTNPSARLPQVRSFRPR